MIGDEDANVGRRLGGDEMMKGTGEGFKKACKKKSKWKRKVRIASDRNDQGCVCCWVYLSCL